MAKNIYVPVFRINVLYIKQFVEITVLKDISIKEHLSFNNEQRKIKLTMALWAPNWFDARQKVNAAMQNTKDAKMPRTNKY